MKVRIKKTSKKAYGGQQSDGALDVTPAAFGGADMKSAKEGREVQQSLTSVPRSKANLEAEGGETAFGPISGDTIPDHYKIKGPRHTNGGVPLNLPDDTFIFSDTKAMKITDPKILTMFGKKAKKGGYTPADLAKPFDINKYKGILMDPDTDRKERETAELMIKNYIMKLGALALAQESKKGFPQGIPEMAKPYMEANGITEDQLLPQEAQEGGATEQPMMKNGGLKEFKGPGDSQVDMNPKQGENRSDWMSRTTGNPGFARSTQTWNGTSWVEEDGSSPNQQNNPKTLGDVESYKNATGQQKALFESMSPQQRQMMRGAAGQNSNKGLQQGDEVRGDGSVWRNGKMIEDGKGSINENFPSGNQRSGYPGGYNQQQGYPNQRGGRRGFSDFNPFGQRAFTKDFDYLTPFNSPTFSGTNTPFTGQMPAGTNNLTSINQSYKKNPFFKSLFNKDMARKEFTTTYNFNGTGSSTPSLAGGNNAISNFQTPKLDFNQSTQSSADAQNQQQSQGSLSNRQFAKDFQNQGFGSKRDMRKALRKGDMTQQEYMDLMDQENSPTTTPIPGSGVYDNSAIPSWITDPIGSATSGTPNNESMITDQIRNSVMNSGKVIDEPSRLPIQSAGQLDSPAFGTLAMRRPSNNPANPTSSRNSFATGSLQGVKDQLTSFDKNQAINRSTTATGNESAINLGGRLNQMRTNAATRIGDNTTEDNTFDFNSDRSTPYQFGQNLKKVKIRRPASSTTVSDGRSMNFNPDYSDGFAYGGYAKDGIEVGDEGNDKRPAYNTLYPASETQAMNPNAVAGEDVDIYDPYFSKAYYGDGDVDRPEFEKTDEEYIEDESYVPRGMPAPKAKSTQTSSQNQKPYDKKQWMGYFPEDVFDMNSSNSNNSQTGVEDDVNENSAVNSGYKMHPEDQAIYDMHTTQMEWFEKKFRPQEARIHNWRNSGINRIENDSSLSKEEQSIAKDELLQYSIQMSNDLEKQYSEKYLKEYDPKRNYGSRMPGASPILANYDLTEEGRALRQRSKEFQNKKAFGGENPILDMFVYGGAEEYPHGGTFHMPMNDYAKDFQSNTNQFTKLDNPYVQTADDPIVNPITGKSPAVVYNSETGGYDETNPEYAEGNNPFSIETTQKVNSAFTFKPSVAMAQAGALGNVIGTGFDAVNDSLAERTARNINRDITDGSKQSTFRGGDMVNNMGQIKQRDDEGYSQYTLTKYGGTPMAMYGAEMGGAYYPTMGDGGTRKVRILPTASHGKTHKNPDGTPKTAEQLQAELDAGANVKVVSKKELPDGTIEIKKSDGTVVYAKGSQGLTKVVDSDLGKAKGSGTAPGAGWADTICNQLKKGVSIDQLVTDGHGTKKGLEAQFADCITETKTDDSEFYEVEAEETIDKKTGKKKCKCFKLDSQGNQTEEVISETIVNADEECPVCEATVEAMRGADPKDPGGYSDFEIEGMRNAQRIKTKIDTPNVMYQQRGDASSMKVTPRTADITAQGNQSVRAMQAAGMKPNQIVAALMGPGAQKNLAETGKRYSQADTYNAGVVTQDSWKNFAANQAVDKTNTDLFNTAATAGAIGRNKQRQLENAKGAAKYAAKGAGEKGRLERAQANFELEDWQLDRNGNPYKRYNPKDPNPTKPEKDLLAQYIYNKGELGADDADNALRIAQQQLKKQSVKYGGFIPRYTTMPYGN